MKFVLISPKNRTVYNFRGDLIKEIIALGHEVVVTGPNNIDVDKIEALGARFIEIPMEKTGVNAKSDLKYIFALKKLFKKEKPDITFGYTIKLVVYGAIAAKMEAMAIGRPVITTDAPGCRQTVVDGKTGFFVPTGDSKALAEAMKKFIENPEPISQMGKESYNFCKENFDVRKINKNLIKYLGIKA